MSRPRAVGRVVRRRVVMVVVALGAGWIVIVPVAAAHPFGPPLAADVWAERATVRVRIVAAEDDWVILGDHTGAFGDPAGVALDPDAQLPRTGAEALASAPAVRDYLVEHVRVAQLAAPADGGGDRSCPGEVSRITPSLRDEGVELTFRCHDLGEGFEVTSTLMTDIHEAYRTAVRGEATAPSHAMLTGAQPSVRMVDDPGGTTAGVVPVVLILAGAGVMAVGLVLLVRRGRTQPRDEVRVHDEVAA